MNQSTPTDEELIALIRPLWIATRPSHEAQAIRAEISVAVARTNRPAGHSLKYMKSRRKTRIPMGDFVGDAKHDDDLPDAKTWTELESYLRNNNACQEAIDAGRRWWLRYRRYNRVPLS